MLAEQRHRQFRPESTEMRFDVRPIRVDPNYSLENAGARTADPLVVGLARQAHFVPHTLVRSGRLLK